MSKLSGVATVPFTSTSTGAWTSRFRSGCVSVMVSMYGCATPATGLLYACSQTR
jgi:hypothetical protein